MMPQFMVAGDAAQPPWFDRYYRCPPLALSDHSRLQQWNVKVRGRSGPGEARAYLRVSAFGAYERVSQNQSHTSQSDTTAVVTTFTFKATLFRAVGPGRGGFSGGRRSVRLRSVLGVDVGW